MSHEIQIEEEKCVGCSLCQLICSFVFTRRFGVAEARIGIQRKSDEESSIAIYSVNLKENCTSCGWCVKYCHYNALSLERPKPKNNDIHVISKV